MGKLRVQQVVVRPWPGPTWPVRAVRGCPDLDCLLSLWQQ